MDLTELYEMPFEDRELERYGLRQGDVLICEGGEPGRCAVWPGSDRRIMYQKAIHRVRPYGELLDGQYLQLHIRDSAMTQELDALFTGTTIKHLTGTSLAKYVLRLPPLNEQRRIVDKIEALTARTRRAKEALDAVPVLLDKLRQSILAAAFRGDLTKEWRAAHPDVEPASVLLDRIRKERRARWEEAELAKARAKGSLPKDDKWKSKYVEPEPVNTDDLPELPEGWAWASAEFLSWHDATPVYGIILPGDDVPNGIPYIRPADMDRQGKVEIHALKKTSPEIASKYRRSSLLPGDVVLSIVGTIGKVMIVPDELRGANITQSSARLRPIPQLRSEFLASALMSPQLTKQFDKYRFGNAVQRLNVEHVRWLAIPVPPLDEQDALLKALTSALGVGLFKRVAEATTEGLNKLDSAILAKAFRGELVPQDPNDEPASALLERIRAERESGVAPSPAKKTRVKRAAKASKSASR